jgi:hypothetical protein
MTQGNSAVDPYSDQNMKKALDEGIESGRYQLLPRISGKRNRFSTIAKGAAFAWVSPSPDPVVARGQLVIDRTLDSDELELALYQGLIIVRGTDPDYQDYQSMLEFIAQRLGPPPGPL